MARDRLASLDSRVRTAEEALANLRAGARPEEIDAARARVAAADAQIATLEKWVGDATVRALVGGIVTEKLVEAGEAPAALHDPNYVPM